MKIAIPTNDLISIADDIVKSVKLKVFYIDKNNIANEEFLEMNLNNDLKDIVSFLLNNSIEMVLINRINNELEILFKEKNIRAICCNELIITNAITNYLKDSNLKETNKTKDA